MAAVDKYPYIKCKKCGDIICSHSRYDREECSCGSIGIWDGPRCPKIMWPGDKTAEEAFEWIGWIGKVPQYQEEAKNE